MKNKRDGAYDPAVEYLRARVAEDIRVIQNNSLQSPETQAWVDAHIELLSLYEDVTYGRNKDSMYGRHVRAGVGAAIQVLVRQWEYREDYPKELRITLRSTRRSRREGPPVGDDLPDAR